MSSTNNEKLSEIIATHVGLFLAYRTLDRAISVEQLVSPANPSRLVVIITPSGWRTDEYVRLLSKLKARKAAYDWAPALNDVIEITHDPSPRNGALPSVNILDIKDGTIFVTEDFDLVPPDILFGSDAVIYLEGPTVSDIHAARAAFLRPPISDDLASILLEASQKILTAGVLRHQHDSLAINLHQFTTHLTSLKMRKH